MWGTPANNSDAGSRPGEMNNGFQARRPFFRRFENLFGVEDPTNSSPVDKVEKDLELQAVQEDSPTSRKTRLRETWSRRSLVMCALVVLTSAILSCVIYFWYTHKLEKLKLAGQHDIEPGELLPAQGEGEDTHGEGEDRHGMAPQIPHRLPVEPEQGGTAGTLLERKDGAPGSASANYKSGKKSALGKHLVNDASPIEAQCPKDPAIPCLWVEKNARIELRSLQDPQEEKSADGSGKNRLVIEWAILDGAAPVPTDRKSSHSAATAASSFVKKQSLSSDRWHGPTSTSGKKKNGNNKADARVQLAGPTKKTHKHPLNENGLTKYPTNNSLKTHGNNYSHQYSAVSFLEESDEHGKTKAEHPHSVSVKSAKLSTSHSRSKKSSMMQNKEAGHANFTQERQVVVPRDRQSSRTSSDVLEMPAPATILDPNIKAGTTEFDPLAYVGRAISAGPYPTVEEVRAFYLEWSEARMDGALYNIAELVKLQMEGFAHQDHHTHDSQSRKNVGEDGVKYLAKGYVVNPKKQPGEKWAKVGRTLRDPGTAVSSRLSSFLEVATGTRKVKTRGKFGQRPKVVPTQILDNTPPEDAPAEKLDAEDSVYSSGVYVEGKDNKKDEAAGKRAAGNSGEVPTGSVDAVQRAFDKPRILASVCIGDVHMSLDSDPVFRNALGHADVNEQDNSSYKDVQDEMAFVVSGSGYEACSSFGNLNSFSCTKDISGSTRIRTYLELNMELSGMFFSGFMFNNPKSKDPIVPMEKKSIRQKAGSVGLHVFESQLAGEGWGGGENGMPKEGPNGENYRSTYNRGMVYVIWPDKDDPDYLDSVQRAGANIPQLIQTYNKEALHRHNLALIEVLRLQLGPNVANDVEAAARFKKGLLSTIRGSGINRIEWRVTKNGSREVLEGALEKVLTAEPTEAATAST